MMPGMIAAVVVAPLLMLIMRTSNNLTSLEAWKEEELAKYQGKHRDRAGIVVVPHKRWIALKFKSCEDCGQESPVRIKWGDPHPVRGYIGVRTHVYCIRCVRRRLIWGHAARDAGCGIFKAKAASDDQGSDRE